VGDGRDGKEAGEDEAKVSKIFQAFLHSSPSPDLAAETARRSRGLVTPEASGDRLYTPIDIPTGIPFEIRNWDQYI